MVLVLGWWVNLTTFLLIRFSFFFSSTPSDWEECLQNDFFVSSGTENLKSICQSTSWSGCLHLRNVSSLILTYLVVTRTSPITAIVFTVVFQANLPYVVPLRFFVHFFLKTTFGLSGRGWFWAGCPSYIQQSPQHQRKQNTLIQFSKNHTVSSFLRTPERMAIASCWHRCTSAIYSNDNYYYYYIS